MGAQLPAISGKQLARLLVKDGWIAAGRRTHGVAYVKESNGRKRICIVQTTTRPLPSGTLSAILGLKQTGLRRKGLVRLINEYGA